MPAVPTRPSNPEVAAAFDTFNPSALPTNAGGTVANGGVLDAHNPAEAASKCQKVTETLIAGLQTLDIDACQVYLHADHTRLQVDTSRAQPRWQRSPSGAMDWGHVVLGVPGVPGVAGASSWQIAGRHGPVELWDFTATQFDTRALVPKLIDLADWGPYAAAERPVCQRAEHYADRQSVDLCALPRPDRLRMYGLP